METEPMTHPDLARAWRELPRWRWMYGMLGLTADGRTFRVIEPLARLHGDWADACPVTTDHATIGCLHALTEEVCGGPVNLDWDEQWEAYSPERPGDPWSVIFASGPTKAHALYALIVEVSRG